MVNAVKMEGWILDVNILQRLRGVDLDEQIFVEHGVRKAIVWICGYCEEGWHEKKEDAEKCCSEEGLNDGKG